jgi:hypothetical protein
MNRGRSSPASTASFLAIGGVISLGRALLANPGRDPLRGRPLRMSRPVEDADRRLDELKCAFPADPVSDGLLDEATPPPRAGQPIDVPDQLVGEHQVRAHFHAHIMAHDDNRLASG